MVAVLVVAIAVVAGFGGWAMTQEDGEARFCTVGLPITPRNYELEGYEVILQDSGDRPGPDECDGPDRPGRGPGESAGTVPRVVLGFDCRYRDADGEVVAVAEPNRPDGTCTRPDM